MGLDFLIPLLDESDTDIQKSVLRAIAHLASTYGTLFIYTTYFLFILF
jgi:hypothetical protein